MVVYGSTDNPGITDNLGGIKIWRIFRFLLIGWFKFVAMCH